MVRRLAAIFGRVLLLVAFLGAFLFHINHDASTRRADDATIAKLIQNLNTAKGRIAWLRTGLLSCERQRLACMEENPCYEASYDALRAPISSHQPLGPDPS
jgi:hypothetical protein